MRTISLAFVAGAILACSPPSTIGGARNPNVLTRSEIVASNVSNAYDAVRMLRPAFLQSHGQGTVSGSDTGYPRVYLNHLLYGDLQSLRTIDVSAISEIHYYTAAEASNRFGLGNMSGAIEVVTNSGP